MIIYLAARRGVWSSEPQFRNNGSNRAVAHTVGTRTPPAPPVAATRGFTIISSSPEPPHVAQELSVPTQRKRKHVPDDDDAGSRLPSISTAANVLLIQIVSHGKHLARTVDLFPSWPAILRDGLEINECNRDIHDTFSEEEIANYEKFRCLLDTFTTTEAERFIVEALDEETGQTFTRRAAADLLAQVGQAKQNENATLKPLIIRWLGCPDGLDQDAKEHRGFKHDETAKYLLPMSQHPFSTQKRLDIDDGKIALDSGDWPVFLWHNNDCGNDPSRRRKGLFRSEILLKAAKAVFTSPSSANGSARSRRQTNASKNNMTEVNPATIAYIATLVYYGLCSDGAFNPTTNAGFDLQAFYHGVKEYLELEMDTERGKKLFKWWNKNLFPNAQTKARPNGPRFPAFDDNDDGEESEGQE
ncbi:hypothetical protein M408DRAFT_328036 [Serendipita vermifera MAFF 305830]|uniref:Uncharacterized protein n=1 Tax=Serendipita vermifera MAFF 305830 TaxID=933852 RepID=A0A0C3BE60_SERVB|nr:hypothetical protein M408DRAFT_328036 [Serendipita vermifera MAFF 305830]